LREATERYGYLDDWELRHHIESFAADEFYFEVFSEEFDDILYMYSRVETEKAELKEGKAVPLKIKFEPGAPFYPLKISSINHGTSEINVYFLSGLAAESLSGPLELEEMKSISSSMFEEYGLYNTPYICWFSHPGDLADLSEDAVFGVDIPASATIVFSSLGTSPPLVFFVWALLIIGALLAVLALELFIIKKLLF
jgi:hypothetical protein